MRALKAFELWMRDKGQEAGGLIQALGPDVVPGLMDIFSRDKQWAEGGSSSICSVFSENRPCERRTRGCGTRGRSLFGIS